MKLWGFQVRPRRGQPDPAGEAARARLHAFGLTRTTAVRSARLYLIEFDGERIDTERVATELLADEVVEECVIIPAGRTANGLPDATAVEVHLRPGVMDPAAGSTCLALAHMGLSVRSVRTARRFEILPRLSDADARRAAGLLGNDCIEEVVLGGRPIEPPPQPPIRPFELRHVPIRELDEAGLARLSRDGHLFLSPAEMQAVQHEFRRLDRDPTDLELETIAQTWSEHCVHKTFKSAVIYNGAPMPLTVNDDDQAIESPPDGPIELRYDNLLRDTIARATHELILENRGPQCLSVFKDNAGIIAFDDEYGVAFKVETHNHPSAIEPYGGAATGLGGCIRDVIGCGLAAKPIASTDVFCVAPPDWPLDALPAGVLHPRQVLSGVVAGVRDYGNRMGIPTVAGAVHFDPRYLGNPLVFCGSVGLIPRDRIHKSASPGDLIVLVGGRTGRDGIHGATFSSAELTDTHADEFAHAVQIGNAIEEKKLLDVILAARDYVPDDGRTGGERVCLFSAITDCGAGGLSSAIGEMGAETGAEVDLDRVPLKYAGLRYDEIWISEAQERMVLAVPPDRLAAFLALCRAEDVEATVIGRFTDSHRLTVRYEGCVVGDLAMQFLHDGLPRAERRAEWSPPALAAPPPPVRAASEFVAELKRRLALPTIASKESIIRVYDHDVQGRTVIRPLVGPRLDGPNDAAVIRPRLDSDRGIAIGCGLCPQLSDVDPYWMAWHAIDEAIRNVVAVGGDPRRTAILDNFCWGRPDEPRRLGELVRAAQACHDAARVCGVPFISGKDSLNNEFAFQPADAAVLRAAMARYGLTLNADATRLAIPGTLLISAVALVDDVHRCVTADLKQAGAPLYLVGQPTRPPGRDASGRPEFDPEVAHRTHLLAAELIRDGLAAAVHDVSDGGLLVALAEMAIAGDRGLHVHGFDDWAWEEEELDRSPLLVGGEGAEAGAFYFDEMPALYLIEPRLERYDEFRRRVRTAPSLLIATVEPDVPPHAAEFRFDVPTTSEAIARVPLGELRDIWQAPLRG